MIPSESRLQLPESISRLGEAGMARTPGGMPVEHVPPVPTDGDQINLPPRLVGDLLLKMLYRRGALSGEQLSEAVKLPFWALDTELLGFQHRRLVQVQGQGARGRRAYIFDLTAEGRDRVREFLASSPYVGPAPVSLEAYRAWTVRRALRDTPVRAPDVARALADLVVDPSLMRRLGPAVNAGRSLFIYGDAGNGKTSISERIPSMYPGHIFIPYAVEMQGAIMQLYDPSVHEAVIHSEAPSESGLMRSPSLYDPRFVLIRRPLVTVGGELTLEQLEPRWDDHLGLYRAPPQLKANGGVFLVDDFGRQRVPPRELLNRWMIPLDRGVDHLSLGGGQMVEVPFDCLVVFATNLEPSDLAEEAFYRRIRHKVRVQDPTPEQYRQIFRDMCIARGIHYEESAVEFIESEYYGRRGIPSRACHPGDILADVCDLADYLGLPPKVERTLLQPACESYFMDAPRAGQGNTSGAATEDPHAH
jgi:hypothetical protein